MSHSIIDFEAEDWQPFDDQREIALYSACVNLGVAVLKNKDHCDDDKYDLIYCETKKLPDGDIDVSDFFPLDSIFNNVGGVPVTLPTKEANTFVGSLNAGQASHALLMMISAAKAYDVPECASTYTKVMNENHKKFEELAEQEKAPTPRRSWIPRLVMG